MSSSNMTPTMQLDLRRTVLKCRPFARIHKNKKPGYVYVNLATLEPLCTQARDVVGAQAQRQPLLKERGTFRNIRKAITIVLLPMRAKTIRATCKRHWECVDNFKLHKFKWESPRGDGMGRRFRKSCLLSSKITFL